MFWIKCKQYSEPGKQDLRLVLDPLQATLARVLGFLHQLFFMSHVPFLHGLCSTCDHSVLGGERADPMECVNVWGAVSRCGFLHLLVKKCCFLCTELFKGSNK